MTVPVTHRRVEAGQGENEDLVWVGDGAAAVFDGATGLTERQYTDGATDAVWYVETLAAEVGERIHDRESLETVAADSISAVAERFSEFVGEESPDRHERPSASGVLLRWSGGSLEYLALDDCSVVIDTIGGCRPVIGERQIPGDERFAREREAMQRLEGVGSEAAIWDRLVEKAIAHRKRQNRPDGFWTFGTDPTAAAHATTGEISLGKVDSLVAFTDGFKPIVEGYDVFETWSDMVAYLRGNGLDRAVRILRTIEAADPDCERYPRPKRSDDLGVLTVAFD